MQKAFIITVDTEGDNLWEYKGGAIGTRNAGFVQRFQTLCERYGFKPVYLTNWEMANDQEFMAFCKETAKAGQCEIGLHVHAWNNPPEYELPNRYGGNAYLVEYPENIMREKLQSTLTLLKEATEFDIVSHRAGRWAMNNTYFRLLGELGIKVDCSYTPGISWLNSRGYSIEGGSDYTSVPNYTHKVHGILEVPMTIRHIRHMSQGSIAHRCKTALRGETVWMRPAVSNVAQMKTIIRQCNRENGCDYVEFMIHSSELMPGGSPYFPTDRAVEGLYDNMSRVFEYAQQHGFAGHTLSEYQKAHQL